MLHIPPFIYWGLGIFFGIYFIVGIIVIFNLVYFYCTIKNKERTKLEK